MMKEIQILITTVDSEAAADAISKLLIEKRLAACVQEFSIKSRYRWEEQINVDPELMLLIKTASDRIEDAIAAIQEIHPYDLPEIVCIPVLGGSRDYLNWVYEETRQIGEKQ